MSAQASRAERTITPTQSQTNRIAGFGILLPPRSIAPRTRTITRARARRTGGGGGPARSCVLSFFSATASAKRPKNSASTRTAFSNSSSSTRSFGAWMFAKPSVVPSIRISASGTASGAR